MTFEYLLITVIVLHFVVGMGYLIWKISFSEPKDKNQMQN